MARNVGDLGEEIAKKFLANKGYEIIARNYYAGRRGEVDLIAIAGINIIFVEVKTRTKTKFSVGLEAVDGYKLKKWYWSAEDFIMKNPVYENHHWRFDVVEIFLDWECRRAKVKWIKEVY